MMDNIVEIKNKTHTCINCRAQNIICPNCKTFLQDFDYYYWLILTRLVGNRNVIIRFANSIANRAIKIIELLKNSVGLVERDKTTIRIKCAKIELLCPCSNRINVILEQGNQLKDYICRKCHNKTFKQISSIESRIEKTDVLLEKIPAVIAMTEEK